MEKIKKSLRKEDGFTLVELLAVIVILGIILAIAIPAIGNVISESRRKAGESEDALILDAARIYFTALDEEADNPVTVEELVDTGYLDARDGNLTSRYAQTVTMDEETGILTGSW